MKSSTVYHGFAMQAEEPIGKLREKLLEFFIPQKLYLLGITSFQKRIEGLFSLHGISKRWIGHYYLLALIQKPEEESVTSIQEKN